MDVTGLILHDHHDQRRLFSYLDDIDGSEVAALGAIWSRLSTLLEVHAAAEEAPFYSERLKLGIGAGGQNRTADEVSDVIKDHNEIPDAIAEVAQHPVGSDGWREAVAKTREANGDHMAEEERDDLADFRRSSDLRPSPPTGSASGSPATPRDGSGRRCDLPQVCSSAQSTGTAPGEAGRHGYT